jgi:recombination protein RecA
LDELLVIGGAARGRLTEIFGPQHVGKTSLAMHLAMKVQSYGIPVIWQDYEQATDFNYAQRIGMSFHPDFMQFSQPESAEEGFTAVEIALEHGFPGLIVIDSIPACKPKAVLEAKIDETARPGYEAFIYTKCIEKILTPLRKSWACFVGLNQMRASIGTNVTKYTPEEKRYNTPGGHAWKHYASVRLQLKLKHGEAWEAKQGVSVIKVKSVKNKLGFPYKECEIQLVPGVGFVG